MGAAISLVHYTGMTATRFLPSVVLPDLSHTASISYFGVIVVAIGTLVVQGAAVLTSSMDRRLAAQALELQTSDRFRHIADHLPLVLALSNADLSEFLFVSRAYKEVWGRTIESVYAHSWSFLDGVHPDDRERFKEALERLIEGEPINGLECRVIRPDGSTSWVLCRGFPVRDSQGQIIRLVGSAQDITDRKRAENALRESEDR